MRVAWLALLSTAEYYREWSGQGFSMFPTFGVSGMGCTEYTGTLRRCISDLMTTGCGTSLEPTKHVQGLSARYCPPPVS
jgi:hypothetical protein